MTVDPGAPGAGPCLRWAVRKSFLDYLGALDDTVVIVEGQVQDGVPEEFDFPLDLPVEPKRIRTRGSVSITAHGGELTLKLVNPMLVLDGGLLAVHVDRGSGSWIHLARARTDVEDLRDAVESETAFTEVLLTLEGSELFGQVYGPGFRLAPLRLENS